MKIPFEFECEVVKSYQDKSGEFHVVGYAATSDFDIQEDLIEPQALHIDEEDFQTQTVCFNHEVDTPIGYLNKVKFEPSKGLWVDVIVDKFATLKETGTKITEAIKQKILGKFSIRARVLSATKKFVSDIGRIARCVLKIQPIEVSLVTVPGNKEAEAINWFITKALTEFEENGGEIKMEYPDFLIDLESEMEGLEKSEGTFPTEEEFLKSWADFCKERADQLKGTDEEIQAKVKGFYGEFCKQQGYPETGYPGPVSKQTIKEVFFLLDKLATGENEKIKGIAQQIKAMLARAAGSPKPYPEYPKPYPYPKAETQKGVTMTEDEKKAADAKAAEEKAAEEKKNAEEAEAKKKEEAAAAEAKTKDDELKKSMRADIVKEIKADLQKEGILRKGFSEDEISKSKETVSKTLEEMNPEERLRTLIRLEGGRA